MSEIAPSMLELLDVQKRYGFLRALMLSKLPGGALDAMFAAKEPKTEAEFDALVDVIRAQTESQS